MMEIYLFFSNAAFKEEYGIGRGEFETFLQYCLALERKSDANARGGFDL